MSENLVSVGNNENSLSKGIVGSPRTLQFPIITVDYTSKVFGCRMLQVKFPDFPMNLIRYYSSGRRNYEKPYDPTNTAPPTCYSLDGITGSRPQEIREFLYPQKDPKPVKVSCYGECRNCFMSKFGTSQVWSNTPAMYRKGPNCSNYGIAFVLWHKPVLDIETNQPIPGETTIIPAVIHVPPTGVGQVGQTFDLAQINYGKSPQEFLYHAYATGGGKSREGMMVVTKKRAAAEDLEKVLELDEKLNSFMDHYVRRMLSGVFDTTGNDGAIWSEDENYDNTGDVPWDEKEVA